MLGLGCFRFARRYFGNHSCFLFLGLLRCFSSPRSPPQPMCSVADVPTLPGTGSPIQKSPDQSLFSNSPRLIAACRVFHRLPTPRHPPSALINLATKSLFDTGMSNAFWVLNSSIRLSKNRTTILGQRMPPSHPDGIRSQKMVEVNGFEPMTSCVQGRRSPS